MPFLLAEILNFQGSTHLIGVGSLSKLIAKEKQRGATIVIATHHKEDLVKMCDVVLKISNGELLDEE